MTTPLINAREVASAWSRLWLLAGWLPLAAAADQVVVSVEKSGTVALLNGKVGIPTEVIDIGRGPRGIELSHDKKHFYVAVTEENAIKRVALDTLAVTASYRCDNPKTFGLSPDGKRLYASNDADASLVAIDLERNAEIGRIAVAKEPEGVAVSPHGRWIVSTSEAESIAQWIDAETLQIAANSPVPARPRYSRFTDDGKQLWVSSEGAAALTVFDAETRQPIKELRFQVPGVAADAIKPVGIRIDNRRRFGYVALGRANQVAVVDAQTLTVAGYLPVGQRVWHLEFSPDQSRLYTANGLSGDVSVVDLETRQTLRAIPVGDFPWGIAVAP